MSRRRFPMMHSESVLTGHYNAFYPRLSAAAKAQLQQEADMMQSKAVHKASMASLKARVESFTHWPHNDASPSGWASSQPFTLALEGFFENAAHSGAADSVCCYACGTSLINWSREDVPSTEHVRHASGKPTPCPLLTLRAQTGVSPSDLAIAAGLVKPSEVELAVGMAVSSSSVGSAINRMQAAYSASEAILAESSARLRERERVSFPSYHGLLNSLEIARHNAVANAAASSSSKPARYSVVGGTSGASLSLARSSLLAPSAAESAMARSTSPGTPSVSPAALATSLDKSDPLYLPVPSADLHEIVYVRAQAASASVHAPKSAAASSGYLAFLDACASETGLPLPGGGSPSRHGAVSASTPLSAFDRVRARHLKRSHSLFTADTYGRNWPSFDDEEDAAASGTASGVSKLPPAAAADLARLRTSTALAKESYRSVKRVRHAAAKSAASGDPGANQVLSDLQQRVAMCKQRYSSAKAMEQAMESSYRKQQQQKDDAAAGGMSDEEEEPASPSSGAPVSSAIMHALLMHEITTAALLHSKEP